MRRYSEEEKPKAIELCYSADLIIQQIVDKLGHPAHQCLGVWLQRDGRCSVQSYKRSFYSLELKLETIDKVLARGDSKTAVSELGVRCLDSIYNWAGIYAFKGQWGLMPKRWTSKSEGDERTRLASLMTWMVSSEDARSSN